MYAKTLIYDLQRRPLQKENMFNQDEDRRALVIFSMDVLWLLVDRVRIPLLNKYNGAFTYISYGTGKIGIFIWQRTELVPFISFTHLLADKFNSFICTINVQQANRIQL